MDNFWSWWQQLPYHIDPILLNIGALQVRYYGLMYMTAFLVFYGLVMYRLKRDNTGFKPEMFEGFMTWAIIAIVVGSRLGYVLFYNLEYFIAHPLEIVWPYQEIDGQKYFGISGLSYHGGFIGGVVVVVLYCWNKKMPIWKFGDLVIPAIPLGYMFGHIGNFLNGELYGRLTDVPWGMYFPTAPTFALRHPSQLYEAFFEGIVLFLILWPLRNAKAAEGMLLGIYLIGYGLARFIIEFYRQPDEQLGFVLGGWSMGQVLCLSMVLIGITILIYRYSFIKRLKI